NRRIIDPLIDPILEHGCHHHRSGAMPTRAEVDAGSRTTLHRLGWACCLRHANRLCHAHARRSWVFAGQHHLAASVSMAPVKKVPPARHSLPRRRPTKQHFLSDRADHMYDAVAPLKYPVNCVAVNVTYPSSLPSLFPPPSTPHGLRSVMLTGTSNVVPMNGM